MNELQALQKAIELVGSQSELARRCQVSQPNIYNWLKRHKRVSHKYVLAVERAVNGAVTRHQLRPDLYPEED